MEIDASDGADKLAKLSRLLKTEAPKEMSRALGKAVSGAVAPLKRVVLGSTDDFLPRRGGLADRVSRSRITHRLRKGNNPKVTLTVRPSSQTLRDPLRVERGRIARPVFGMAHSRAPWQLQDVKPGWASEPIKDNAEIPQRALIEAIDDFTDRIERQI